MKVEKNDLDLYQIQLDDEERKSLDHLAELTSQSTDNLIVIIFTAALASIVLASQVKKAYDKVSK